MEISDIEISRITISPFNVRKNLEESALDNLANSIKENGLLQPIIVKIKNKTKFELIAGQRRLLACKKLRWKKIPAIVIENVDDLKALTLSTVENLQRVDLNPIDKMNAFSRMYKIYDENIKKVAQATSYSEQTIRKYLNLKGLSKPIKEEILKGGISEGLDTLVTLSKFVKEKDQVHVLSEVKGLTQKEKMEHIRNIVRIEGREDISIQEKIRAMKIIKNFAIKIFSYRIQLLIQLFQDERKFREIVENLKIEFNNLKLKSPILKIILERIVFFQNFENLILNEKPFNTDDFERCLNIFAYHPSELFDILIEDFKRNYSEYDDNFKDEISKDLRNMLSINILRSKTSKYLELL